MLVILGSSHLVCTRFRTPMSVAREPSVALSSRPCAGATGRRRDAAAVMLGMPVRLHGETLAPGPSGPYWLIIRGKQACVATKPGTGAAHAQRDVALPCSRQASMRTVPDSHMRVASQREFNTKRLMGSSDLPAPAELCRPRPTCAGPTGRSGTAGSAADRNGTQPVR